MNRQELLVLLGAYGVPLREWGTGEAKTVEHLLDEVNSSEAAIVEEDGVLHRVVYGAVLNVFYADGAATWKLKEAKQVFRDGRERVRDLDTSIGEKLKAGEDAKAGARRALTEELNIPDLLPLAPQPDIVKGPVPSVSFPGLKTKYIMRVFEVFLPAALYKPDGYVEEQTDKTNYYVWEKIA
ncbi:MAG: hypothetical protein HYT14_00185 [Candidatus Liptonbacteria bacterium]|nr:hypothetical protein [Candidatus Liptonbacteria bacterium]